MYIAVDTKVVALILVYKIIIATTIRFIQQQKLYCSAILRIIERNHILCIVDLDIMTHFHGPIQSLLD